MAPLVPKGIEKKLQRGQQSAKPCHPKKGQLFWEWGQNGEWRFFIASDTALVTWSSLIILKKMVVKYARVLIGNLPTARQRVSSTTTFPVCDRARRGGWEGIKPPFTVVPSSLLIRCESSIRMRCCDTHEVEVGYTDHTKARGDKGKKSVYHNY